MTPITENLLPGRARVPASPNFKIHWLYPGPKNLPDDATYAKGVESLSPAVTEGCGALPWVNAPKPHQL